MSWEETQQHHEYLFWGMHALLAETKLSNTEFKFFLLDLLEIVETLAGTGSGIGAILAAKFINIRTKSEKAEKAPDLIYQALEGS